MNVLKKLRVIHLELVELGVVVFDSIFFQRLVHVEHSSVVFPGVAAGMGVEGQVPLQDVVDGFLRTYLERDVEGDFVVVIGLGLQFGCTEWLINFLLWFKPRENVEALESLTTSAQAERARRCCTLKHETNQQ